MHNFLYCFSEKNLKFNAVSTTEKTPKQASRLLELVPNPNRLNEIDQYLPFGTSEVSKAKSLLY